MTNVDHLFLTFLAAVDLKIYRKCGIILFDPYGEGEGEGVLHAERMAEINKQGERLLL